MRIFKAETRGLREDEQASKGGTPAAEPQAPGRQLDEGTHGTAPQDTARSTPPGSTSS
jgi:sec-independent protein translocase protein TatA